MATSDSGNQFVTFIRQKPLAKFTQRRAQSGFVHSGRGISFTARRKMNYRPDNRAINFLPDPPCERSRGLLMRAYCGDVDAKIYRGISAARSTVAIKHVCGVPREVPAVTFFAE